MSETKKHNHDAIESGMRQQPAEYPILFSTDMVQAILGGRKTQTRREVNTKKQNWDAQKLDFTQLRFIVPAQVSHKSKAYQKAVIGTHAFFTGEGYEGHQLGTKCQFGQPGDLLWVRETFQFFLADPTKAAYFASENEATQKHVIWRPSIHMPKSVARIWLQVKEISVERLKDISDEDAIAEGIEEYGPFGEYKGSIHPGGGMMRYRAYGHASRAFQDIWSDIYGVDSWKSNPWVWVVEFKVLSTTGRPEIISTSPG